MLLGSNEDVSEGENFGNILCKSELVAEYATVIGPLCSYARLMINE